MANTTFFDYLMTGESGDEAQARKIAEQKAKIELEKAKRAAAIEEENRLREQQALAAIGGAQTAIGATADLSAIKKEGESLPVLEAIASGSKPSPQFTAFVKNNPLLMNRADALNEPGYTNERTGETAPSYAKSADAERDRQALAKIGANAVPGAASGYEAAAAKLGPLGTTDAGKDFLATQRNIADDQATAEQKKAALDASMANSEANREAVAELQKQKDAEALRRAGSKPAPGSGGGINSYNLSPEENDALSRAINNGLDPYQVNSRTAKIYAQQEIVNPGRKWNQLGATAKFERSTSTMNTQALLNAINPLFDGILAAGKDLGNSRIQFMNKAINIAKEQTGDPKIVQFNNQRDDLVAEIERGLLGTGVLSDSKYMRALHNINSAQSYPQLEAAVKGMRIVINARLEALKAGPSGSPGETGKSGTTKSGKKFTILE